jgi:2-polyprenyl-3-methyl-5-hydroxy-6-metoxy-1,4-benzoquinol methylase
MRPITRLSPEAARFQQGRKQDPLTKHFSTLGVSRAHLTSALNLGCGSGVSTLRMVAQGYRVLGIDRDPAALAAARQYHAESSFGLSKVDFVQADIRELPIDQKKFKLVTALNVLNNMQKEEQLEVIENMKSATEFLGSCIISASQSQPDAPEWEQSRSFEPHALTELFGTEDWRIRARYQTPGPDGSPLTNVIAYKIA